MDERSQNRRGKVTFDDQGHLILKISPKLVFKLLLILGLSFAASYAPLEGMTSASRVCLGLFVAATGLWMTEVIPPFATAIMVMVLSVYLLGHPAAGGLESDYQLYLNPISSPVLVLFFGGFILALGATKHGLDIRLASAFIRPFGTKPRMVLLGVILVTAVFSMFMSNTATTAMMIAIIGPLFRKFEGREPFKKALVLAVPFAANVGGMGTIIGTPPNAVAASVLERMGHAISFTRWMAVGVPIVAVLLLFLWFLLFQVFKPRTDKLEVLFPEPLAVTWDLIVVTITFAVTVFLWIAQPWTHIPSAVVALLPIMVFTMFGILTRDDLKRIEWHVLILIAGGMSLGVAMKQSGLSDVLLQYLSIIPVSPTILIVLIAVFAIALSNFMSNTAAANLIIPLVLAMNLPSPIFGVVAIALACSMAMSLPISTPPNAIAFATEIVETRDLVRYGTLISAAGMVIMLVFLFLLRSAGFL